MQEPVKFWYEHPAKDLVRAGFIGCGGHAFRNVYPAFRYAPIDLRAVCDLRRDLAESVARTFGARAALTDHRELLRDPSIEAVFIVTGYTQEGHPQATALALEALEAGKHVWMEKPPAASVAQVVELRDAALRNQRSVLVGFKKMFTPGVEKLRQIIANPAFGGLSSIAVRYPQDLPEDTGSDRAMVGFLDHIVHPASVLHALAGPIRRAYIEREDRTGATVATLSFMSGAVGILHLAAGQGGTSPLERVEVIGKDSNAVLENGIHLTWYRPGDRGPYGRAASFTNDDDMAPLTWEPEFSLGNLANNSLFLLGYVQEIEAFCRAARAGVQPSSGNLDDAIAIMRLYEAYRRPLGRPVDLEA